MQNFLPIDMYFPAHPKTLKLKKLAGPGAAGHLILLWIWAAKNRPDGNLAAMEDGDIEAAAEWHGQPGRFVLACRESKYFDGPSGDYALHDWHYWQRHYAQTMARQKSTERVRKHRAMKRDGSVTSRFTPTLQPVTRTIGTTGSVNGISDLDALHVTNETPRLEERRVDKRREDQEHPAPKPRWSPPSSLPGFAEFWGLHPHKVEGAICERIWRERHFEQISETINGALRDQLTWEKFRGEQVQFMKRAPAWLRARRWEDEPPASPAPENFPVMHLTDKERMDAIHARMREEAEERRRSIREEADRNAPRIDGNGTAFVDALKARGVMAPNRLAAPQGHQERK